jgi:hypothetical protein
MKIPNAENAVVDIEKLTDYCLSETHPRGKHKARVFATVLGLTLDNAVDLRNALLSAVRSEEASAGEQDEYGKRYILDFQMKHLGNDATVRSTWIIRQSEDFPRLTSCYVL